MGQKKRMRKLKIARQTDGQLDRLIEKERDTGRERVREIQTDIERCNRDVA